MQTTNLNIMCTLYFDPGSPEFRMVEVLHDLLGVKLADARDAVDLHRVKCPKDRREEFIKTIEKHGGKVI
jgi:hypothetical protein